MNTGTSLSSKALAGRTRTGDVRTVAGIPCQVTERADIAVRGVAGTVTLVRNPGYMPPVR
jgi:hypothetical protein